MIRLVVFLVAILAAAAGLHWLGERPGTVSLVWQGYVVETSVFRFVILSALAVVGATLAWSGLRVLWRAPALIGRHLNRRRERKGLDAISTGMIAIGSGDKRSAVQAAVLARKALPNEPLTHLLRAQAAQLQGDGTTARRIFEAMLASPDTEQLGLRGLYLEAVKVDEHEAARQFAERALALNPKLEWPAVSLFDLQCRSGAWDGALETLASARRHGHVDEATAKRRRAVLLTAQAMAQEEAEPDRALEKALEAHGLAPDLVPAAALAARVLAGRGMTAKAGKIVDRTWKIAPHPDLAAAYAYARAGDMASDRLARVRRLAALNPTSLEGPIAIATTAIDMRAWSAAREALAPVLGTNPSARVCALMARIESDGANDVGRAKEWLSRAVQAPRDPAWTADGVVAEAWAPVSPITGKLDAFEWRVPAEVSSRPDVALLSERIEQLLRLDAGGTDRQQASPDGPPKAAAIEVVAVEPVDVSIRPNGRVGARTDDRAAVLMPASRVRDPVEFITDAPVDPPRATAAADRYEITTSAKT
jgi:HemY protein